jgi:ABC-type multidrug transport system ATPase subunit
MESTMVILDEPTTGLDADGWSRLRELLATLRRDGVAMLLVSHEVAFLNSECERVVVLEAGRLRERSVAATTPRAGELAF